MSKLKLLMLKGLPGSGKSTWAKELLAKDKRKWKRVNKDDFRAMLDNGKWSRDNEKFVIMSRDSIIINAIGSGYNVVVDDTNLAPKHEERLKQLASQTGAELDVQDFTYVPVEQCIKQDLMRPASVGEAVIRGMYNQFLKPKPQEIEFDLKLPLAVICDLDGTLALFGDANPYERDFMLDRLNLPVSGILGTYCANEMGYEKTKLILVSGRTDKFKKMTEQWLEKNLIEYDELYMRKDGDSRKDSIVKEEIYNEHIKGKYNVSFVLDDRNQVVELWRSLGLTCLQVADGNF